MRRFAKCLRCIHGAPPHTPPKRTFCKKSPLESRKTTFDFYCLVFHRLLSRYQKAGVHAAYSPSASQRACSARREINPQNRHRRVASCLFSMKRVSPAKASLRLQAAIRLAFAPKVSKGRRTRRRLLMDYTFEDVSKFSALIFDGL